MVLRFNIWLGLALVLCLKCQAQGGDWVKATYSAEGISFLEVDLYRGWLEVEASHSGDVEIEYAAYSYDEYVASGQWVYIPIGRSKPAIEPEQATLKISNEISREIVAVKIKMPAGVHLKADINHAGFVKTHGLKGQQEINTFSGWARLEAAEGSVSAHIVRDGDIDVNYLHLKKGVYTALSVYDGQIALALPQNGFSAFEASSDMGEVSDEHGLEWQRSAPRQFEVKSADGTSELKTSYTQKASGKTADSRFLLKNVRGDIQIKKNQGKI